MSNKLFDEVAGVHGPLHGGWRGHTDVKPLVAFTLEQALDMAGVKADATATSIDLSAKDGNWSNGVGMWGDDQAQEGSCVSWGWRHAIQRVSLELGHDIQPHAARWIYHWMQVMFEPTSLGQDTGAFVAWGAQVVTTMGMALESDWPYTDNPADLVPAPSWIANYRAAYYKNRAAVSVPATVAGFKQALAANMGVLFGFLVYQSLYKAQGNGNVPTPQIGKFFDPLLGGHCNYCFGAQDDASWDGGGYILALNQWGTFSPKNILRIPYSFFSLKDPANGPLISDCWSVSPLK